MIKKGKKTGDKKEIKKPKKAAPAKKQFPQYDQPKEKIDRFTNFDNDPMPVHIVKNPNGRPSIYTPELAKRICDLVATTPSGLKKLCAENEWMPVHGTINMWRLHNKEFSALYAQAKLAQAELYAEDCIDIADESKLDVITKYNHDGEAYEVANNEFINRSRLRVDTRKWMAAKLLPKLYGDAKKLEDAEAQNDMLRKELRELRAQLDSKNQKEY